MEATPFTSLVAQYQKLVEVMNKLSSTLDLNTLLKDIMNVAVDLAGAQEASILLYDQHQHQLFFQSTTNETQLPELKDIPVPEESIAGWVALHRTTAIVNNAEQDERHYENIDKQINFKTASLIAVPLVAQDKLIGVLEVLNKKAGNFDGEDQEILLALGSQAAVAIENSRLFQQSDLIAEFVHELRTPMASVMAAAYLLQRQELAAEQRAKLAQTVYAETQRLNELASVFLDLSSLESGRASLRLKRFPPLALLDECRQVAQIKANENNVSIVLDAPASLGEIEADRDKLKQVLLNLLSNAVKYNRRDGTVWLTARPEANRLVIAIRDTGVGIPPEQIHRLFTKFFRASNVEGNTPGTGLGLSIAKRIVEMHGGQISVESVINQGTTFTFFLPYK